MHSICDLWKSSIWIPYHLQFKLSFLASIFFSHSNIHSAQLLSLPIVGAVVAGYCYCDASIRLCLFLYRPFDSMQSGKKSGHLHKSFKRFIEHDWRSLLQIETEGQRRRRMQPSIRWFDRINILAFNSMDDKLTTVNFYRISIKLNALSTTIKRHQNRSVIHSIQPTLY